MQNFDYARAVTLPDAVAATADPGTLPLAGGTELVNWLKEGIVAPRRLLDLNRLPGLDRVEVRDGTLTIGALVRMSDLAAHPAVRRDFPVLAEALLKSASAQIRTMASMGGNLMQRTRCPYFRAEVDLPCNKRRPGSGCAAMDGQNRAAAIFGTSDHCIATHPSDAAVALAALDAVVRVEGPEGARAIPLTGFHRLPGDTPERETELRPGEVIVGIEVPASPLAAHSHYLKVRERTSYEFALVSAAAAVVLDGDRIVEARLALGGVAPRPWRLTAAEQALRGVALSDESALRAALEADFAQARTRKHNAFKPELAKRTAIRALQTAGGLA